MGTLFSSKSERYLFTSVFVCLSFNEVEQSSRRRAARWLKQVVIATMGKSSEHLGKLGKGQWQTRDGWGAGVKKIRAPSCMGWSISGRSTQRTLYPPLGDFHIVFLTCGHPREGDQYEPCKPELQKCLEVLFSNMFLLPHTIHCFLSV